MGSEGTSAPVGSRRVRGEREGEHRASREVGNVNPDTEITFQFGARDTDRGDGVQRTHGERRSAPNLHTFIVSLPLSDPAGPRQPSACPASDPIQTEEQMGAGPSLHGDPRGHGQQVTPSYILGARV